MITKLSLAVSFQNYAKLYFELSRDFSNDLRKSDEKIAQYYYKRARQLMGIE